MAGMKRFVTYIYSYEDKAKGSNIGFAKIEIRGEDCRIEIHLRGVYAWQAACKVYLFREDAGDIEGVLIGEMKLANGSGDFGTILKVGKIGDTPFGIGEMEGIFLLSEDDRIFMSRWKEGNALEVCRERFKEWRPAPEKEQEEKAVQPAPQEEREADGPKCMANVGNIQDAPEGPVDVPQSNCAGMRCGETPLQSEETMQATEIPMRNFFPAYDWLEIWENLKKSHPVFTPFESPEAECIQIELKNLRELPKRYWYLGNNSFLLHGFFNYRYLVVGKTAEERWFIGVPGIYQRQERVMAAIFGFPEFIPTAASKEDNENAEPINRFGCWYRYIEE